MHSLTSRKNKQILIGIWEINQAPHQWCCVWFNDENVPQSLILNQINETLIMNKIAESFPQYTTIQLKFITAISPHKIFLKTLILPYDISPKELETQCIIALEENLPLPLSEIWFDFMAVELPKTQVSKHRRIDLFAILKEIALQSIQAYSPVNIQVLDCVLNALSRSFGYLSPIQNTEKYDSIYIYRDFNFIVVFTNQPQNWLYQVKTVIDPIELVNAFTQKHNLNPKHYIVYDSAQPNYSYPSEYIRITSAYSPVALGCALWDGGDEGK